MSKMGLKTHTAYPEIQVDKKTSDWVARLYDGKGVVVWEKKGKAKDRKDASAKAGALIQGQADKYLIPAEKEA